MYCSSPLPPAARPLAGLWSMCTNLRVLNMDGVEQMCNTHFQAIRSLQNLTTLRFRRCTLAPKFSLSAQMDGSFLPRRLTTFCLGFENVVPDMVTYMRQEQESFFLGSLTRLRHLEVTSCFVVLCVDEAHLLKLAHSLSTLFTFRLPCERVAAFVRDVFEGHGIEIRVLGPV